MRLLHTQKCELETFINEIPPYAILSHTWSQEEVSFKDIGDETTRSNLKGWEKVVSCCRLAADDGWEFVWIDTCCIDKSDPTELGEVINSMFRWYEEAEVCYAYLSDTPARYHSVHGQPVNIPLEMAFQKQPLVYEGLDVTRASGPVILALCGCYLGRHWVTGGSGQ